MVRKVRVKVPQYWKTCLCQLAKIQATNEKYSQYVSTSIRMHRCHGDDENLIAAVLDTVNNMKLILECEYCVATFISIFHGMNMWTIK